MHVIQTMNYSYRRYQIIDACEETILMPFSKDTMFWSPNDSLSFMLPLKPSIMDQSIVMCFSRFHFGVNSSFRIHGYVYCLGEDVVRRIPAETIIHETFVNDDNDICLLFHLLSNEMTSITKIFFNLTLT